MAGTHEAGLAACAKHFACRHQEIPDRDHDVKASERTLREAYLRPFEACVDAGVDSLMGVELGLAAQQALGDDVPLMTISSSNSIEEIAEKITDHIQDGTDRRDDVSVLLGDIAGHHVGKAAEPAGSHATAAE